MATLEFVRTYLDDLLVISKDSLDDHLEKLRMVLIRLQEAWLKINANKSTFCALELEYLGYTLLGLFYGRFTRYEFSQVVNHTS